MDHIMGLLRKPFEQRLIYQKRRFLNEFESFRRYHNEFMRAYVQRFRRTQRSLTAVGVNIAGTFDSDSLGSRLLDRSGLSHHDQRMVLVGTQQSLDLEAIAECLVLQWPEFRPAPPVVGKDGPSKGKGKGTATSSSSSTPSTSHTSVTTKGGSKGKRQAFITQRSHAEETIDEEAEEFADALEEADAGQMDEDERPQEEEPEEPSEDVDLGALAEVLTVTARKLSGATLGRKFSAGGKKKKSPDELRKVTHCAACGALGHWHQDPSCPMNQGKPGSGGKAFGKGSKGSSSTYRAGPASEKKGGKTHQVSMVHHERGATDITSPEEFGSLFSTFMVTTPFMVTEVKRESDMMGFMVLDSACQRTCCGQQWYDLHKKFLGNHFMKCKEVPTHDVYQFGKGDPTTSSIQAYIPVFFKDIPILIGVGILPENIPLLGGNTLLDTLGSVIDLPSRTVHFTKIGCSVPLHVRNGHFAVHIFDASCSRPHELHVWKQLSCPSVWKDPHPELLHVPPKPMKDKANVLTCNSKPREPHLDETTTTAMAGALEAHVSCLEAFKRNVWIYMARAVRLGMMDQ